MSDLNVGEQMPPRDAVQAPQVAMDERAWTTLHEALVKQTDALLACEHLAVSNDAVGKSVDGLLVEVKALAARVEALEKAVSGCERIQQAGQGPGFFLQITDRIGALGKWLIDEGKGWRVLVGAILLVIALAGWLPRVWPLVQLVLPGDIQ